MRRGSKHTAEAKEACAAWHRGKPKSAEQIAKMCIAQQRRRRREREAKMARMKAA